MERMSAIERISFHLNIRDEKPNQQLAKELAESSDTDGINEIARYLRDKNPNVRSDCIKILYEIGYIKPDLITRYVDEFLNLLDSNQNRMVWGGMIALSTIADIVPEKVWAGIDKVLQAIKGGSVITVVSGVKVLSAVAAHDDHYSARIFPVLTELLETCIPRDVPIHVENMLACINKENSQITLDILRAREPELSKTQMTRLKRVINTIQKI